LKAFLASRRLAGKYDLSPPVEIERVVRQHATLTFVAIPFDDVDGISLNLKVKGKSPHVIVNKNNPLTRQRFTLAHELGHIVIPWHIGTIIDRTDPHADVGLNGYWEIEAEANAFAAELLMPSAWISSLTAQELDLARVHRTVFEQCNTSPLASAIQLVRRLPSNIVYVAERDGRVEFSGRTDGTIASQLPWGSAFSDDAYCYSAAHYETSSYGRTFHWWKLPEEMELATTDPRDWREILNQILDDIGIPHEELYKAKQSINGVIANANSNAVRSGKYTVGTVISMSIQRFRDRPQYAQLVQHPLFETLVFKRSLELTSRKR
jgi:hypothetical protein